VELLASMGQIMAGGNYLQLGALRLLQNSSFPSGWIMGDPLLWPAWWAGRRPSGRPWRVSEDIGGVNEILAVWG